MAQLNVLPPGLAGYVASQQHRGQQESQQLQQLGLLAQLQAQQQQQARLKKADQQDEAIRAAAAQLGPGATMEDLAAAISRIDPMKGAGLLEKAQAGALRDVQMRKYRSEADNLERGAVARSRLASLQTPEGSFDPRGFGLTDPSVTPKVAPNDEAARQAAIEAMRRGENVAVNVPNPGNVRALALQSNLPQGALTELLKQTGQEAPQGYTLSPGGIRFGPDNQQVAAAPFAPRQPQTSYDQPRGAVVDRASGIATPVSNLPPLIPRSTSASTDPTQPGGIGSNMVQDPQTGQKYSVNTRIGKAWRMQEDGRWVDINPNDVPKNAQRVGNIGTSGARESVFTQRLVQASNQASNDLANVAQLPLTVSTGVFGGRKQGPSLFAATTEVLANTVTTQEVQIYNTMATGMQRNLAAIESAGLMPSGALTHQMDAVMLKEGDTNLVKLSKLAQTRQIVETGLEVILSNPRVSESEKELVRTIHERLIKSVPFTQKDVIRLMASPNKTMQEIMKETVTGGGVVKPYADAEKERRYQEWRKANP